MEKILEAIKEVFPEADLNALNEATKLSHLPGWDSMNAVNLVLEIEERFNCSSLKLEFSDALTIGEVCAALHARGVIV